MTLAHQNRPYMGVATVRAVDLFSADIIQLVEHNRPARWRDIFDVHLMPESILTELTEEDAAEITRQAKLVRLDTFQNRAAGNARHISATPRPDHHPAIIDADKITVSTRTHANAYAPLRSEAIAYALLGTDEYVAVRYVREETSDGENVEDGWAIFKRNDLVNIQVVVDNPHEESSP